MLKLHNIYLRKFLLLFVTIFFILGAIFYFWIKSIILEEIKIDLLNNINIFSIQLQNIKDINKLTKQIKKLTSLRVTVLDNDGKVIGESDYDKNIMENHKNRTEIITSKYQEYGFVLRYSNTLKKELLYVSKMFKNNDKIYYIRMARDTKTINKTFVSIIVKITLLFLIFSFIAFRITIGINKKLGEETKNILKFLRKLTKQTKEITISSSYSYEFDKITKLLSNVSFSLAKKDRQKSKYTTKLKLLNRQKDDIIAAISHEFKNPIAIINGYAQTLTQDKEINPKIRERFLEKIFSNTNKLTNMIDRLRLSIRLSDRNKSINISKCNINLLTRSIVEDLQLSYQNRKIVIKSEDIFLEVDETLFGIAITNLIENALKYSQDEIEIIITKEKLSIKDFGIGINQKEISKITNKFYRVSNNGWNNSLGVGLSLVKNILNLHNFKLNIQSQEDKYSIFSILFI